MHLRPMHTSIMDIFKVFESLVCCLKPYGCTLMPLHRPSWPQIWESWVACGRGCTQEFPATKSKKLIKVPRTQQSKKQKVRTNHSHTPPQIADFRSQRIKRKLTPRSILRDIHVALSQLWRRSGTLAWVVPATTSPKSTPKVGFTHKNRPAQPFPPPKKN